MFGSESSAVVPITFTPLEHPKGHWHGRVWQVDSVALAPYIAHMALGNYRHVREILHELEAEPALDASHLDAETIAGAKALLIATNPDDPYHRDGWLFQTLSWIAARIEQEGALVLCQPPHPLHTQTGLDALELAFGPDGSTVEQVVVGEDKAVKKPRRTVRKVWKEIAAIEAGERRPLLRHGVSSLLAAREDLDALAIVNGIVWKSTVSHRLAITDDKPGAPADRAKRLFKGFEEIVDGGPERRQIALLYVENLRPWLAELAQHAIDHLDTLKS